MRKSREIRARDILAIYRNSSLFTRIHACIRFKTCPFLSIEKFVPKEGLIVDYGCGHGLFSHILASKARQRTIIGIDKSVKKIESAIKSMGSERYSGRISFFPGAIGDLDITRCDAITMIDVLYLVPEELQKGLLIQFWQKLDEKGVLIIKTMKKKPGCKYWFSFFQEILSVKLLRITEGDAFHSVDEGTLAGILKEVGFHVSRHEVDRGSIYPHVLFVCRK